MITNSPEDFLKLYGLVLEEQHFHNEAHQKRIEFYSGLLSALVTATGIGFFEAESLPQFVLLLFGGLLTVVLAFAAKNTAFREYQALIETISVRAKIEQELGLTRSRMTEEAAPESYWQGEPLIPPRLLCARRESPSAGHFIDTWKRRGLQRTARWLFHLFMLAGATMVFLSVCQILSELNRLPSWVCW